MVLLKCHCISLLKYKKDLSTFHYGSIKMSNMGQDVKEAMTSTFHYGSIKIVAELVEKKNRD